MQQGEEFVIRPIEVGKRNDTDMIVLKGLREGEAGRPRKSDRGRQARQEAVEEFRMKKIVIRLVILAWSAGAGYGVMDAVPGDAAAPEPSRHHQSSQGRRGCPHLRSRRTARGAFGYADRPEPVRNRAGDRNWRRSARFAKEKDLVVEFDDSEVNSRIEEKQLELDQIDEQIKKAQADLAIRNNQDQVELLRARYSRAPAELEVKRNELLPQIDQTKNELNLEEAKRRLTQLESDIKSRQEQAQAEMAVLNEKKQQGPARKCPASGSASQQVKLLSPMSGLVAIRQNRQGLVLPGMQIPDIREGDQVQPGIPVADVLDLSELEVIAKVGELDRANLREGQDVTIRLDAIGDKTFHGKIKSMSGTASANVFSGDPAKKFDVVFSIDMKELLSGLGAKPEQIDKMIAHGRSQPQEAGRDHGVDGGPRMMGGGPGGRRWPRWPLKVEWPAAWAAECPVAWLADARWTAGGMDAGQGARRRCRRPRRTVPAAAVAVKVVVAEARGAGGAGGMSPEDQHKDARGHAEGSQAARACRIFPPKSVRR